MQQLDRTAFDDFEDPQTIWEMYGELLDIYEDVNFSAKSIAYLINVDVKLVNKALHRLIYFKAVKCVGTDTWGAKLYRLNEDFTG